jgi:hypothetical protein
MRNVLLSIIKTISYWASEVQMIETVNVQQVAYYLPLFIKKQLKYRG